MKIVPRVALMVLTGAMLISRVNADPVSSQSDPTVNPHALEDADGVPLQVTHPELFQVSPDDLEKKRKADEKAKNDEDWLLRAYEKQMRESTSKDPTRSFINQISSNQEFSKMAGVPYLGNPDDTRLALKTGSSTSGNISLRADPLLNNPSARASSLLSKPFFASASTLPGLSSTLPLSLSGHNAAPPSSTADFIPPPRRELVTPPPADSDSMALTSPGLVAAESHHAGDDFSTDLTLDLPQEEPNPQAGDHVTTIPMLSLPLKTNTERLQRQNAAMGLATNKATTTTVVKPVPVAPPYVPEVETVPISRPSFGRSAIADPHSDTFLH